MKKTIFGFMNKNLNELTIIIESLDENFNSHDFIRKFEQKFTEEYVEFLNSYSDNREIKVHSQIARFLSKNKKILSIDKTNRVSSLNVHNRNSSVQGWKKVK